MRTKDKTRSLSYGVMKMRHNVTTKVCVPLTVTYETDNHYSTPETIRDLENREVMSLSVSRSLLSLTN